MLRKLITFALLVVFLSSVKVDEVFGQVAYTRHLSDLRIKELQNLAVRLEHSVNNEIYPCEEYYDYVCGRNRQLFSILGSLPQGSVIISLLIDIQNDDQQFEAKEKMMSFFLSCNLVKSVDDCYQESFHYFRPVFGYIIASKHIERQDYKNIMDVLERFIARVVRTEHFATHAIKYKLEAFKDKFKFSHTYFQISDLNTEYKEINLFKDNYEHNIKNLEMGIKYSNMSYISGIPKAILDWTFYLYQSKNKPMSYYYATLNIHLWMLFYNNTSRTEQKKYEDIADCLKLSPIFNTLEEARLLAVIYFKSFQNAWMEYREWITSTTTSQEIYDHENEILRRYKLDNKQIFFNLYAQNFCDFGKELAENIFYLGLKQNYDFYNVNSCGFQTLRGIECG